MLQIYPAYAFVPVAPVCAGPFALKSSARRRCPQAGGPQAAARGGRGGAGTTGSAAHVCRSDGALCRCARQAPLAPANAQAQWRRGRGLGVYASAGRWKVQLHPDGLLLALKASILAVLAPAELMCGADVEIHSLVRSPELNGVRSKVVEPQDPGSGRWGVKIDSDGRVLALKPANLVLIRKHAPMVPRPRAQAGLTEEQRRLATRLNELQAADDWRGIAALEREALALAREAHPGVAGVAYSTLGKEQDRLVTRLNEKRRPTGGASRRWSARRWRWRGT